MDRSKDSHDRRKNVSGTAVVALKDVKHIELCARGSVQAKLQVINLILEFVDTENEEGV